MCGHHALTRRLTTAGALGLISILAVELTLSVRHQSPTWNEPDHLLAGYRYWLCSDFSVNSEHPPLLKLLAAAPLLFMRLRIPQLPRGPSKLEANLAGRKFLFANDADDVLFRARVAASAFTLLLAALLFEAASSMLGHGPAFLALLLFVSEPNLLAHGALVTTDAGLTCCLFAAVYAFYRYVRRPSRLKLVACGLTAGLAFSVKHSGILALPILGLLAGAELWRGRRPFPESAYPARNNSEGVGRHALRLGAALLLVVGIGGAVLWASYGFRFRAGVANQPMTPSLAEVVKDLANPLESRLILGLDRWRVLPESYLYGLADVLITSAGPRPTFLFGKLYPRGQWFYFPAVLIVKSTLGFLLLLLLSLVTGTLMRPEMRREILFLVIPAVIFFSFSLSSGLNVGVRHILPVYPFLLVLAAAGASNLLIRKRGWAYVVMVLLALHLFSSGRAFPHYLAYSNEVWGGPENTYKLLSDSNVDWGQGLESTRLYLSQRHIRECWMTYFGTADPSYYQIACKLLPEPFSKWWGNPVQVVPRVSQGTLLISATEMAGTYWGPAELNPYDQFLESRPVKNIGGSILVYEGRFDLTLASALSHSGRALELAVGHHLSQALTEARTAVALAPRSVQTQDILAEVLAEAKQISEARQAYRTALFLAQTISPDYQQRWIPYLQAQLDHL